jgi:hypothetical protein
MKVRTRSTFGLILKPLFIARLKLQNYLIQQTNTDLVVSFIFNLEKHLLRALADTGANSTSILEAYASAPSIKTKNKYNHVEYNGW